MPFPLAHPAAILPLKRFCPKGLSFSALVIGSIAPDVAYISGPLDVDVFSHSFTGCMVFGLPVGALMLVLFYRFRASVVHFLPARHRESLLPLCQRPAGSVQIMGLSLIIGVLTHVILDAFTHKDSWLVANWPLLQHRVVTIYDHNIRVSHVAWYACSFVGIAWVCFAYDRWLLLKKNTVGGISTLSSWLNGFLVAVLFLPVELLHHSVHGSKGVAIVAGLAVFAVILAAWRLGDSPATVPDPSG